jgi:hypothetical protein
MALCLVQQRDYSGFIIPACSCSNYVPGRKTEAVAYIKQTAARDIANKPYTIVQKDTMEHVHVSAPADKNVVEKTMEPQSMCTSNRNVISVDKRKNKDEVT